MGLANCDVAITRAVFDTLANHYPERMGVLWMYDAPYIFWGLWTVGETLCPEYKSLGIVGVTSLLGLKEVLNTLYLSNTQDGG